ncbi:MAG: hypothetical protein CL846_05130 [Crocinitomicaceae bacterium]|nr:hypothetical protein [Crocinitomicaceae bacterium]|tara:strand:+ start:441 stop:1121 length:681 start_codon:yes stop_codon:yes gene_type:complete
MNNKRIWGSLMPREKLIQYGKSSLTDDELIGVLLSSGSSKKPIQKLANDVLSLANNKLNTLARLDVNELTQINGIGHAKACLLVCALELSKRTICDNNDTEKVNSSSKAFQVIAKKLMHINHEEFWLLGLNKSNQILDLTQISKGGLDATYVDIRLIFHKLILKKCSSFIVAHNHPSSNMKPSKADLLLTNKILKASKFFDIQLLDHLIIGDNGYFSFADYNLLKT